jgi:hypothetical protein
MGVLDEKLHIRLSESLRIQGGPVVEQRQRAGRCRGRPANSLQRRKEQYLLKMSLYAGNPFLALYHRPGK